MSPVISVLINASGAVVAIISLIVSYTTNQKLRKQQEIINNYKIKQYIKADFAIEYTYRSKIGFSTISIVNIGKNVAANIIIHTSELSDDVACNKEDIRVPLLNSGEGVNTQILINNPQSFPQLRVTWDDDFNSNNEKFLSLSPA